MTKTQNPAARGANRVPEIKALGRALDLQNPSETLPESPAVRALVRRFRLSVYHARVVCELAGIGGAA